MEVKRLFDVLHYQKEKHPQQVAISNYKRWRIGGNKYR
jgi:hypothetical protein